MDVSRVQDHIVIVDLGGNCAWGGAGRGAAVFYTR